MRYRLTPSIVRGWLYCRVCGRCCENTEMILLEEDVERISSYTGLRAEDFAERLGGRFKLKNVNGKCVFFDAEKGSCTIYPVRPIGCSLYPVVVDEYEGLTVDEYCPLSKLVGSYEKEKAGAVLRALYPKLGLQPPPYRRP
ncbi:YkgJ family cysteine cluster protein [Thermofilum pendens]|uniref:YkgJ family cysteine cluster protein n=1 Tax=Thermofilum pendens (strain DSM 2475 / Hrk 5) TaxID=368408 RepID=A1RWC7_THEPD|nr:YkgJ family cysteine cluster protein [Thermofilum pendens]ABL77507.1 protein of unknown function UPF0153 [Thermofilum pendens Hrk 5]